MFFSFVRTVALRRAAVFGRRRDAVLRPHLFCTDISLFLRSCSFALKCASHLLPKSGPRELLQRYTRCSSPGAASDVNFWGVVASRSDRFRLNGVSGPQAPFPFSLRVLLLCRPFPLDRDETNQVLGSVAEAARLVSARNIKVVHALPGTDPALSATTVGGTGAGTAAGSEALDGVAAGVGGVGGGGGGRGGFAGEEAGDQVPLFRCGNRRLERDHPFRRSSAIGHAV